MISKIRSKKLISQRGRERFQFYLERRSSLDKGFASLTKVYALAIIRGTCGKVSKNWVHIATSGFISLVEPSFNIQYAQEAYQILG